MDNTKLKSLTLSKTASATVDGERRVTFVASDSSEDRDHEHMVVETLRLPLKGGGSIRVGELPAEGLSGTIDIPMLTNHEAWDVAKTIGSVRKASFENGQLVLECGISSRDYAQDVFKLIDEGHLNNAFSISVGDYDYNFDTGAISNGEITEVSLVTRGSNRNAKVLAVKSAGEKNMDDSNTTPEVKDAQVEAPAETTVAETEEVNTEAEVEAKAEENLTEAVTEVTEAEKATTEPAEAQADEATNNEPKEKSMSMDKIAAAQVTVEKRADQTVTANKSVATDYLKTKQAEIDFANVLVKYAGAEAADVKKAWEAHLKTKGITNPEVLLPTPFITRIEDAANDDTADAIIWRSLNHTGLTVTRAMYNTVGTDVEAGRAKGHGGNNADKGEEELTFADRVIRGQYIYKYLTIPREVVRENEDTNALLLYVFNELPRRVISEVVRAVSIGDGRDENSEFKVKSFVSILADAQRADGELDPDGVRYASTYQRAAGESLFEAIVRAEATITADGTKTAIMSAAKRADLRLANVAGTGLVFGATGAGLTDAIEVQNIATPSWLNETNAPRVEAIIYAGRAYEVVGDAGTEMFTGFALKQNKHEYLDEIYAGGALARPNAAVVILAPESE